MITIPWLILAAVLGALAGWLARGLWISRRLQAMAFDTLKEQTDAWAQFTEAVTIQGRRFLARRGQRTWLNVGGPRINYAPKISGSDEQRSSVDYPWFLRSLVVDAGDVGGLRFIAEALEKSRMASVVYETENGVAFQGDGLVMDYTWRGDLHAIEVSLTGPGRLKMMGDVVAEKREP